MTPSAREFEPAPVPRRAWGVLVAVTALLIAGLTLLAHREPLPAPAWLLAPALVTVLLVAPLLALRRRRIAVEGDELVVAATVYTQRMRLDAFDLDHARIVDLREHTALKPMLGLNRFGVPGLRAGHYLLRDRRRAFCLLTRFDRVLVLPQRDGKVWLLSPEKPHDLLEHLRRLAVPQPHR